MRCRCGRAHAEHDKTPPFGRHSDDNLPTCPGFQPVMSRPVDVPAPTGPVNEDAE